MHYLLRHKYTHNVVIYHVTYPRPFQTIDSSRVQNEKRTHVLVFLINLEIKAHQILLVRKHCHTYGVRRSLDILLTPPCLRDG